MSEKTGKTPTRRTPKQPEPKCDNCKYFATRALNGVGYIMCRRFPEPIETEPNHWCGEWSKK